MKEKIEEILVVYMPIIILWAYAIICILILIGTIFLILL
jgi:hypothetical protein